MILTTVILGGLLAAVHGVQLDTIAMLISAFMAAYLAATFAAVLIERKAA